MNWLPNFAVSRASSSDDKALIVQAAPAAARALSAWPQRRQRLGIAHPPQAELRGGKGIEKLHHQARVGLIGQYLPLGDAAREIPGLGRPAAMCDQEARIVSERQPVVLAQPQSMHRSRATKASVRAGFEAAAIPLPDKFSSPQQRQTRPHRYVS